MLCVRLVRLVRLVHTGEQDRSRAQISSPTGTKPNKVRGSDDVAGRSPCDVEQKEKKPTRAVTCVCSFRSWRLAPVPVRADRLGRGPGPYWDRVCIGTGTGVRRKFTLQKTSLHKARGGTTGRARAGTVQTKYGLPVCLIWESTSRQESL